MTRSTLVAASALAAALSAPDAAAQVGSVRGRVVDVEGNPVAEAQVRVEPVRARGLSYQSKTKEDGGFLQMTSQTSGPWRITVTKDGFEPWESPAPVHVPLGGDTVELPAVTLRPTAAALRARALADGEPSAVFRQATDLLLEAESAAQAGDEDEVAEKLASAQAAFQAFIEKHPGEAQAYLNLGLIQAKRQRWEEAGTTYLKATGANPGLADAYVGAGAAFINARAVVRAIEVLEEGLAHNPGHVRVMSLLGLARYNEGSYGEAAELFEQIRQLAPVEPDPYYYLGMIAVVEDRSEAAVELLETYVSMNPPDARNLEAARDLLAALSGPAE
jgi:cytochrome c-type biogenesis protein CcmH/NrfG